MMQRLINYFRASYPGIFLVTAEESRAAEDIIGAAKATGKGVLTWSATEGIRIVRPNPRAINDTEDLAAAARERIENTIYIMRDAAEFPYDRDPVLARAIRDLLAWGPSKGSTVVFTGPVPKMHRTFEKMFTVVDYSLPGPDALQRIVTGILESAGMKNDGNGEEIIRALSGLSTSEAENACALSLIETGKLDRETITREKIQNVKRSGMLEIIPPNPAGLDAIGGMDLLKAWILQSLNAFSKAAREYPLRTRRGIVAIGPPGTGKSLMAKCIGTALQRHTLKADIGKMFSSLVGESEANIRAMLSLADAMAPCVLWIDEVEKGFAGAGGGGKLDSGVTDRIFGTVLNWMQERTSDVFVVMTANNIAGLPPEFLRKGRMDETFAVDIPSASERAEIFRIHLKLRKRAAMAETVTADSACVKATEGYTGAEIETLTEEAFYTAFNARRDVTEADLVTAAGATIPLSVSQREKVESIRAWARENARPVSSESDASKAAEWKNQADNISSGRRMFSADTKAEG